MNNLIICNFCDLFGFNSNKNPISRLPIKINSTMYPVDFEFEKNKKYETFDIHKHINDKVLIYNYYKDGYIVLHMFTEEGATAEKFANGSSENMIYKYGKEKWIKDAYENGSFSIAPSLEYIRSEYDSARKANEAIHETKNNPENIKITTSEGKEMKPILSCETTHVSLSPDEYILCFAYDYDEGLYKEFKGSDACLAIHDVKEFARRINKEFNKLMSGYIGIDSRVDYGNHLSTLGVSFSKPFDYVYQREYRFSWIPENPKQKIDITYILEENEEEIKKIIPERIKIKIGSIKDISEIKLKDK